MFIKSKLSKIFYSLKLQDNGECTVGLLHEIVNFYNVIRCNMF